ncbi:MAG: hypothetical protein KZQ77_19435 [Candidatus Thiodiazotropha sp. (ex Notomyrtea botanica)]|nr:hypothetical protein [Candidatus Thiodiazotropha sp. (ex Notomyrtea botanica)]
MNIRNLLNLSRYPKVVVLLVSASFVFALSMSATADNRSQVEFDDFEENASGPLDGLDLKENRIWVNDTVYYLARTVRVKGTSTKLGLLTDLKPGEKVKLTLNPNEKEPSIPYVVQIERE